MISALKKHIDGSKCIFLLKQLVRQSPKSPATSLFSDSSVFSIVLHSLSGQTGFAVCPTAASLVFLPLSVHLSTDF